MNIEYCHKCCTMGKAKSKELLDKNDSAYDAATDFMGFVEECFKNCQHKDCHNKVSDK